MSYRSIAPQLKISCYNCRFFQLSDDMLNGMCFYHSRENGKAAIGIGTCSNFSMKGDAEFSWSSVLNRSASARERSPITG
jgi:hypothetical protein